MRRRTLTSVAAAMLALLSAHATEARTVRVDAQQRSSREAALEVARAPLGDIVRMDRLAVADGPALSLELVKRELLAPDFRLVVGGEVQASPARRSYLFGHVAGDPSAMAVVWVEADGSGWGGSVWHGQRRLELERREARAEGRLNEDYVLREGLVEQPQWDFETNDGISPAAHLRSLAAQARRGKPKPPPPPTPIVYAPGAELAAAIRIDTDFELMELMRTPEAARALIEETIAEVSAMYHAEVGMSLVIEELVLHTSINDPWETPSAEDMVDQLYEFALTWDAQHPVAQFPRAFGLMFTGKNFGGGVGGIAFLETLCAADFDEGGQLGYGGGSYSIVKLNNRFARPTFVTAHELGHTIGSEHTHCYRANDHLLKWGAADRLRGGLDPIDRCADQCLDGVDQPFDGGSVMSYCAFRHLTLGSDGTHGERSGRARTLIRSRIDERGRRCMTRTNDPYQLVVTPGAKAVTLGWSDVFGTETGWVVEQRQANGSFKQIKKLKANTRTLQLTRLKPGTYTYRVKATFKNAVSDTSAVVSAVVN